MYIKVNEYQHERAGYCDQGSKKIEYMRMNGEDRKRQILRVARHVFAEENHYGATMAKIARQADEDVDSLFMQVFELLEKGNIKV